MRAWALVVQEEYSALVTALMMSLDPIKSYSLDLCSYYSMPLCSCWCVVQTLSCFREILKTILKEAHFYYVWGATERVMDPTAESDNILLVLVEYKLSKRILERRVSEQRVVVKDSLYYANISFRLNSSRQTNCQFLCSHARDITRVVLSDRLPI